MVRGLFQVRFYEGSTRVPPGSARAAGVARGDLIWFHKGSTTVPQVLQELRGGWLR